MWPPRDAVTEQTLDAEARVADLYAEALFHWAPTVTAAVLPTLTAAATEQTGELPPDPDAVVAAQDHWGTLAASIIIPGVAALWGGHAAAAAVPLGIDPTWLAKVLPEPLDDFLLTYLQLANRVPSLVRDELRSIVRDTPDSVRAAVREAVTPGSAMLRKLSTRMGYHGSSILNHALMTVAQHAGATDKIWFCKLDDRVRDSHWAADGQRVPLNSTFTVGISQMGFPGDPRGPANEVFNCRCHLVVVPADAKTPTHHAPADEAAKRAERGITRDADNPDELTAAAQETPVTTPAVVEPTTDEELFRTFTDAVIAYIGVLTSDNRLLAKDIAFDVRTPPLPLMWMRHTGRGGHDNAYTVGVIEDARIDGDKVLASGYLLNTPDADEAADQLKHGVTRPSIDIGRRQWRLQDSDGNELTDAAWWDMELNAQVVTTFTEAELIGMTLVATPAFGETSVTINETMEARPTALVAAATEAFQPRAFPAKFFEDPQLLGDTASTFGDDGRIFGHIACWKSRHRSVQNKRITPPHSPSGYAQFHTSRVRLDDGRWLPVGRLTVGTGHAPDRLDGGPAQAHYDHTGTCFALVRVGEDAHGVWFSGVSAPWATPEQIEEGVSAPLSGDWRDFGQGLDLVAALAVNTPGFVVRGRDDEAGRPVALVASLGPAPGTRHAPGLSLDDIRTVVAEVFDEARERDRRRAETEQLLAEAKAKVGPPPTPEDEIAELLARTW